ncbi:MAG TPA: hypothetical protein VNE63_14385 [Candidatus Acidoferrales bacterium]|nr:hypothetical protein [Candidatus Acidoferrales bacterium]
MSEQQANQQSESGRVAGDRRCLCHEVMDHFSDFLGVSPEVRKHLANSRIEFLKAIREVIDARIERISRAAQHGTKISVE